MSMYTFTPPKSGTFGTSAVQEDGVEAGAQGVTWQSVTLSLPDDTPLPVPDDPTRWERRNGRIIATYTRDELGTAVGLALEQKRAGLEARLERGLEVLAAATGCPDAEAERLLAHWDALDADYGVVIGMIAEVIGNG